MRATFEYEGHQADVTLGAEALSIVGQGAGGPGFEVPLSDIYWATRIERGLVVHVFQWATRGMLFWQSRFLKRRDLVLGADSGVADEWVAAIRGDVPDKRRALVIVNPRGGVGKAMTIFREEVEPILLLGGIEVVLRTTEHRGHAKEITEAEENLGTYDVLVVVGGDGTIHEALNGVMARRDWRDAIKVPLCPIAGGSGNALAVSLRLQNPLQAALALVRGKTHPLDVCSIMQGDKRFFGFLSLSWAMVSDVDIESETLRWMGEARFTVWAIYRMIFLRRYRGTLSYIEHTARPGDSDSVHVDIEAGQAGPNGLPSLEYIGAGAPKAADPAWRKVQDTFVSFVACKHQYLNSDMRMCPHAHPSDGAIDVVALKNCSRGSLLSMFLNVDKGTHVDSPAVHYYKCKAFKLEPRNGAGFVVVDGELVENAPTEYEVHQALWRVVGV